MRRTSRRDSTRSQIRKRPQPRLPASRTQEDRDTGGVITKPRTATPLLTVRRTTRRDSTRHRRTKPRPRDNNTTLNSEKDIQEGQHKVPNTETTTTTTTARTATCRPNPGGQRPTTPPQKDNPQSGGDRLQRPRRLQRERLPASRTQAGGGPRHQHNSAPYRCRSFRQTTKTQTLTTHPPARAITDHEQDTTYTRGKREGAGGSRGNGTGEIIVIIGHPRS